MCVCMRQRLRQIRSVRECVCEGVNMRDSKSQRMQDTLIE